MRFTTFSILENPLSHLRKAIRLFWHHVPLVNPGSFHLVFYLTRKNNLIILSPLVITLCVEIQKKNWGKSHLLPSGAYLYVYTYKTCIYICVHAYAYARYMFIYVHRQHIHIHVKICLYEGFQAALSFLVSISILTFPYNKDQLTLINFKTCQYFHPIALEFFWSQLTANETNPVSRMVLPGTQTVSRCQSSLQSLSAISLLDNCNDEVWPSV